MRQAEGKESGQAPDVGDRQVYETAGPGVKRVILEKVGA